MGLYSTAMWLAAAAVLSVAHGAATTVHKPGVCVMYKQCGIVGKFGDNRPLDCVYNKPAVAPTGDFKVSLASFCGEEYGDLACCDIDEFNTMIAKTNLGIAQGFLQNCPACWQNWKSIFCQLTCSSNQSMFLNVTQTAPVANTTESHVKKLTYYMNPQMANGFYDSCINVTFQQTGGKASGFLCGNTDCPSPQYWLDYLGKYQNPGSPFEMDFIQTNQSLPDGMEALNVPQVPCNTAGPLACSCNDCYASCPTPPPPASPSGCYVAFGSGQARCLDFSLGIIYLGFLLFSGILCAVYWKKWCSHRQEYLVVGEEPQTKPGFFQCYGMSMERYLSPKFARLGELCHDHPWKIILVSLAFAAALGGGAAMFTYTTDPVQLWSSPDSLARRQMDYFDQQFGPFYRTEQIIVTATKPVYTFWEGANVNITFGHMMQLNTLNAALELQNTVAALTAEYDGKNVSLTDICMQPLYPTNDNCTIMSPLQYFQNDPERLNYAVPILDIDYHSHMVHCVNDPSFVGKPTEFPCMATFDGPVDPNVVLGGFPGIEYTSAEAIVITYVVTNHLDTELNKPANAWEKVFLDYLVDYSNENISIVYMAERSIQDEIIRESTADIGTIAISYILMFVYVSISLGQVDRCARLCVDSRFVLGLVGVFIVLLAVFASVGIFSYAKVPATLIIVEVVPFLCLAVGVDNIFILVQTFQRKPLSSNLRIRIGETLAQVGPSMLLSSLSETVAFAIGASTSMPAVRVFAAYAAMAVFIDFLLQITMFMSVMVIDARRAEDNRIDCVPCVHVNVPSVDRHDKRRSWLFRAIEKWYQPALFHPVCKFIVMAAFLAATFVSIALVPRVERGLDQNLALPKDSYLIPYFNELYEYLHTGAPVYFVVDDHPYTTAPDQNSVCASRGCQDDSVLSQIHTASREPAISKIALPANSWLDTYFQWMSPNQQCCWKYANGSYCPHDGNATLCTPCISVTEYQINNNRPPPKQFWDNFHRFLEDNPDTICAFGGHPSFNQSVHANYTTQTIYASNFMTYSSILVTQEDYIGALSYVRSLTDSMEEELGLTVFAYSVWYVFYEQYLTIGQDTGFTLGVAAAAIFVVTTILLSNVGAAIVVTMTVAMIVVDLMGIMYLWGIQLNAVSLVNLVMCFGIGVEFTAHITRSFVVAEGDRETRAKSALINMGSSVLSGITFTKFVGIIVLAFSKSQLFQVYYFRMYLCMVFVGAAHGLIFLPVFLSLVGPHADHKNGKQPGGELRNPDAVHNRLINESSTASYYGTQVVDSATTRLYPEVPRSSY
jgi:Niemann-Pick C1 protein